MSANAVMTIRMDENLIKEAEIICDEIGVSISAAITSFVKKMVMERKIPFSLSTTRDIETQDKISDARAMELFEEFSGSIDGDIDYKADLAEALDEKYANTY